MFDKLSVERDVTTTGHEKDFKYLRGNESATG